MPKSEFGYAAGVMVLGRDDLIQVFRNSILNFKSISIEQRNLLETTNQTSIKIMKVLNVGRL